MEGDCREPWREGTSMVLRGGACVGVFFDGLRRLHGAAKAVQGLPTAG